jgi:hypothetical protein
MDVRQKKGTIKSNAHDYGASDGDGKSRSEQ